MTKSKDEKPAEVDDDGPVIRPFADFLREQSRGTTHDELSETPHTLIARVVDTRKKGSLQLTIRVEPLKDDADVLVVSDEIKVRGCPSTTARRRCSTPTSTATSRAPTPTS